MDLLKDLTRELRDRDADARDAGTAEATADGASDDRDSPPEADAPARDDEHVCRFCQTAFEARRGACPECGAQLILRGER